MNGDKDKFLSISKRKIGNVTFGNDELGKIKGKGMVSLSNGKEKSQDVLLVDGLKHNFLSATSTEKPLQLVHMDLCGPSGQEGTWKEKYFMMIIVLEYEGLCSFYH
jgi:hypothetical protein